MKISKLLLLPLATLALATSGQAQITIYDNPFVVSGGTGGGGNSSVSASIPNWAVNTGATGAIHTAVSRIFVSDRVFKDAPPDTFGMIGMDGAGGTTIPKFLSTTTDVSFSTSTPDLTFNWLQGNGGDGASPLKLAIQIDSTQWYVSSANFTTPGQTVTDFASLTSTTAVQQMVEFSATAADWTILNFVQDTVLSLGGTPGSDLSGTITGLGFFTNDVTTTDNIRIANFNVTAVPEPSTCALAMVGLLGMLVIARRRKQTHS